MDNNTSYLAGMIGSLQDEIENTNEKLDEIIRILKEIKDNQ